MKATNLLWVVVLIALAPSSAVGKPKNGKGKSDPHPQQQAPQSASVRLSKFTAAHLDKILAPIDQKVALPRAEVSNFRLSFVDEWAKAPELEKAQYQIAVGVCDALNSAMDEREKAVASLQRAAALHGSSDLGGRRKENLGKGIKGQTELKRELHEEKDRKQDAKRNDNVFITEHKTAWTKSTLQLRQNINMLLTRQLGAERAAEQAKAATASLAPADTK